ncbi:MAG: hypothetical protein PHS17_16445 [Desulfobacterales bacterium]|nr:hypothetical protein [Desulfobacterales bacterium]
MAEKVFQFTGIKNPRVVEMNDERWQWTLPIEISYLDALLLVSQLCLALKHPDNNGLIADFARALGEKLVRRFMEEIPEFGMDVVRRLEWDKAFGLD